MANRGECGVADTTKLVFPLFFTPNGDGLNDTWKVEVQDWNHPVDVKLQIFDRSGIELAQITNITQGWSGNYQGEAMPQDNYLYVLTVEGTQTQYVGYFTLIRYSGNQ
jgi:gliding motility-associated-like protein